MANPSVQGNSTSTEEVHPNTSGFLLRPVTSFIVGIILGSIFGIAGEGWMDGIASGILSAIGVLYLQGFVKASSLVKSFNRIKKDSLTSIEHFKNESMLSLHYIQLALGFEKLYDLARTLSTKQFLFYKTVTDNIASRGGAIVVKAEAQRYLEHLEALLPISNKSFLATLRGGRDNPEFTLDWFFVYKNGLSPGQRMGWLTSARDAKLQNKIRLLLFSEDEIKSFLVQKEKRKELLNAMLNRGDGGDAGKVYQVDPDRLFDILSESLGNEESRVAYDDFAIFDDQVVLKHNGAASLTVSIKDQMHVYREVFKPLTTHPTLFRELTLSHYGDITWATWDNQNIDKGSS
ncbi:hypothetical protein KAR91_06200 [Candidatus Pacearchaeota archaeon]|nr:hypothetical protein [Candidatus Pacearchaeota archaeon]